MRPPIISRRRLSLLVVGLLLGAIVGPLNAADVEGRLLNGERIRDGQLREWSDINQRPSLAGRMLFDAQNPARWVVDHNVGLPESPVRYIEFHGGDRLAGEVVGWQPADPEPFRPRPAALLVKPESSYEWTEQEPRDAWPVAADWARRIVWQTRPAQEFQPGTAWLTSGARLEFRSVRWSPTGCTLLTPSGELTSLEWQQLAEMHLPAPDGWAVYHRLLAHIAPSLNAMLVQAEQADGSRWTVSTDQLRPRHWGDANLPRSWLQLVQPAWSIERLAVRVPQIARWRFFSPLEPPLTCFDPISVTQNSLFGSSRRWALDRSSHGGPLATRDGEYGWGLGVHATTVLEYVVHPSVTGVRSEVGLDREMGEGGCITARIEQGGTVWEQAHLQGSDRPVDSGWIDLSSEAVPEAPRLKLVIDADHAERPPGADPFDVRDAALWLEPRWRLDRDRTLEAMAQYRLKELSGWAGWSLAPERAAELRAKTLYDDFYGRDPHFRQIVRLPEPFVRLTRSWKFGPQDRWLALAACRPRENSADTRLIVHFSGRVLADEKIPRRESATDPEPILVPVADFAGQSVPVEVWLLPEGPDAYVELGGQSSGRYPPGILCLFDEEARSLTGMAGVTFDRVTAPEAAPDVVYSGRVAGHVRGTTEQASLPGVLARITDQARLGEFRTLVWAWRQRSGQQASLTLADAGTLPADPLLGGTDALARALPTTRQAQRDRERGLRHGYRYEAGQASPRRNDVEPVNVQPQPPTEWTYISRDAYGDFGTIDLTGLRIGAGEGGELSFDHVYLARSWQDQERAKRPDPGAVPELPRPGDPALVAHTYDPSLWPLVVSSVIPQFSLEQCPNGGLLHGLQQGQPNVLETVPESNEKPALLRTVATIPAGKRARLELRVSHPTDSDWKLRVRVNREVIHEQLIDAAVTLPQYGWALIELDLSPYAGREILLDLEHSSDDGQRDPAFWRRAAVVID